MSTFMLMLEGLSQLILGTFMVAGLAITVVLSGVTWRLRGIIGWPGTLLFAAIQSTILSFAVGGWAVLFGLWIMAGEPTGWKPKAIWDNGDWKRAALLGARIGGFGALLVPLSTFLAYYGEPQIKALRNNREFTLPFWRSKKQLLNWSGAWNEVWFGMLFAVCSSVLTVGLW